MQWRRNEFESGGGAPVWTESGRGHRSGAKRRKNVVLVVLHFLALKAQLIILVSAFLMVSTVWSVSRLLFYSRCPTVPSHL